MRTALSLSLTALFLLSSCHKSSSPSTDSNSNWLATCDNDSDCPDSSCVCGVCSDRCDRDSDCDRNPETEAICIAPSTKGIASKCASPLVDEGASRICLRRCTTDEQCGPDFRCLQRACVYTTTLSSEGTLDGPCTADGDCASTLECNDDFICVQSGDRPDGSSDVSADASHDASSDPSSDASSDPSSDTSSDASVDAQASPDVFGAPDAETEEGLSAREPPQPDEQGDECETTDDCEPELSCERGICMPLWDHVSCDPAASNRPECDDDEDCDTGQLCHLDGTCIEPGLCDAYGDATLATVGSGTPFALTDSHIYLLYQDTGTETGNSFGDPEQDSAITRMSIEGRDEETLVSEHGWVKKLVMEGNDIYFQDNDIFLQTTLGLPVEEPVWRLNISDGGYPVRVMDGQWGPWTVDREFFYQHVAEDVTFKGEIRRGDRVTGSPETIGVIDGASWDIEVDSQFLYLMSGYDLVAVTKTDGVATTLAADVAADSIVLGSEHIFCVSSDQVVSVTKTGDGLETVATEMGTIDRGMRQYRDHVYWSRRYDDENSVIERAPISSGDREELANLGEDRRENPYFAVGDRGLFYRFNGHLIRHVLPEYYDAEASQGEEGGPCFDDATCNGDLTCMDLYCAHL